MRVIGAGSKEMYARILRPVILPAVPMAMSMILLKEVIHPTSIFPLLLLATVGILIYVAIYLLLKENDYERKLFFEVLENITVRSKLLLKVAARRNE
jgi:hypothetical protein